MKPEEFYNRLGLNIEKERIRLGYSQAEMSKKTWYVHINV